MKEIRLHEQRQKKAGLCSDDGWCSRSFKRCKCVKLNLAVPLPPVVLQAASRRAGRAWALQVTQRISRNAQAEEGKIRDLGRRELQAQEAWLPALFLCSGRSAGSHIHIHIHITYLI